MYYQASTPEDPTRISFDGSKHSADWCIIESMIAFGSHRYRPMGEAEAFVFAPRSMQGYGGGAGWALFASGEGG